MKIKSLSAGVILLGAVGTGGTFGADKVIDPYTEKGSHYELPIKADIQQGERVEIAKDRAAMTLKGWNDEYAITIEPQIPSTLLGASERPFTTPAKRPLLSKKMEFKSGDVTAFIEPKAGKDNEFDIDFTLASKPDTNVFTYKIEGTEDFDFFYQPELTPEEIADGVERPEDVVGSYAVYHKTKANHRLGSTNYATGKIMHIYRPKAIDALGNEIWADLAYTDNTLSVTVPQEWLKTAVYPVTIDPTIGNTNSGASGSQTSSGQIVGTCAALGEEGTFSKITARVNSSAAFDVGDTAKGSIYTDTGTLATDLSNSTDEVAGAQSNETWVDFSFASPPTLSAADYCVMIWSNNAISWDADSGSSGHCFDGSGHTYPTWPADVSCTSSTIKSIYATYTADAGEAPATPETTYQAKVNNGHVRLNNGHMIIQ